jgi:hypothetical protein
MRSPAELSRPALERTLRAASLASLAGLALLLLPRGVGPPGAAAVGGDDLGGTGGALAEWTRSPRAETLGVSLPATPAPAARDWLAALRNSGVAVRWSGGSLTPLAAEAQPVADPAGGLRVLVAAPAGALVTLAGSPGVLDSTRAARGGAAFNLPMRVNGLRALSGGGGALATEPDSPAPRRVVVLGRAGWETKYVTLALEERGWVVDSRTGVAPGVDITRGTPLPLDTARQAAVVVLDSLGEAEVRAVLGFVRSGGGLVLGPGAGGVPGAPAGGPGRRAHPVAAVISEVAPRRGLGLSPVAPLRPGSVVLEERDGLVAVAARRVGAGRVVQIGYEETWRWRLSGEGAAADAHRAWWASAVAAAAYRPAAPPAAPRDAADPAPYAALVAALGEPSPDAAPPSPRPDPRRFIPPLAVLCLAALSAELASRRLRGAP